MGSRTTGDKRRHVELKKIKWCKALALGFAVHTIVSTACISAGEALRLIDQRHIVRSDFILVSGDTVVGPGAQLLPRLHRVSDPRLLS